MSRITYENCCRGECNRAGGGGGDIPPTLADGLIALTRLFGWGGVEGWVRGQEEGVSVQGKWLDYRNSHAINTKNLWLVPFVCDFVMRLREADIPYPREDFSFYSKSLLWSPSSQTQPRDRALFQSKSKSRETLTTKRRFYFAVTVRKFWFSHSWSTPPEPSLCFYYRL